MNRIEVRTNQGSYIGGEKVYGAVYLWICSADPCQGVKLKFKGYEKCQWEYRKVEDRNGQIEAIKELCPPFKKTLFRAEMKLVEYPDGIPMGCYCYPFQYTLCQGLPGSFNASGSQPTGEKWEAEIRYKVTAHVVMPGNLGQPLRAEQELMINENQPLSTVEPENVSAERSVKICCCIPRGNVFVNTRLDKTAYVPGETAKLQVDVQNSSSVDIDSFIVKLVRVVTLRPQDKDLSGQQITERYGRPFVFDALINKRCGGCVGKQRRTSICKNFPRRLKENDFVQCNIDLELMDESGDTKDFQPACSGTSVKCMYHVDVEMGIKWAEPIAVQLPVLLRAPTNDMWRDWEPPQWVDRCQTVDVKGTFSVPTQLLGSQLFSNVPGFNKDPFSEF